MTDREKAEEALAKAGFVWVPARCEYVRNEGLAHIDVWWCGDEFQMRGFAEDLPSLLSPTLTPEEKELLSLVSDALEVSADEQDDFKETKRLFNLSQGVDNLIARLGGGWV